MADTINYGKVKAETGVGITPVGTILPWAKATAPNGFLKCDGSAVSRTTYSDLFDVVGTTYGVGDGSTTFNLPDLTSRNPIGANTTTTVGQTAGAKDTTGAGFTLQNNLSTGSFNNLAATTSDNLAFAASQNLALQTAQNLAGSVTQNLGLTPTQNLATSDAQNLAVTSTGNISSHTLVIGEVPVHNHPGSGGSGTQNVRPQGAGNSGSFRASGTGNAGSNQGHDHGHNLAGSIQGNISTGIQGTVASTVQGAVGSTLTGNVARNLQGNLNFQKQGSVTTNLQGNVTANITGDVTVDNVSLYQPHLVAIYIIKF